MYFTYPSTAAESGTEKEIKEFAAQYNVKFDMFSKIDVNFSGAHPLWNFLKKKQGMFMLYAFFEILCFIGAD